MASVNDHSLIGPSQLGETLISIRVEAFREDGYATSKLERLSAPFSGLVPGLPVAVDGADENPSAYTKFGELHPPTKKTTCRRRSADLMFPTGRPKGSHWMRSRITRNEYAPQLGSHSGLTIPAPAKK